MTHLDDLNEEDAIKHKKIKNSELMPILIRKGLGGLNKEIFYYKRTDERANLLSQLQREKKDINRKSFGV